MCLINFMHDFLPYKIFYSWNNTNLKGIISKIPIIHTIQSVKINQNQHHKHFDRTRKQYGSPRELNNNQTNSVNEIII